MSNVLAIVVASLVSPAVLAVITSRIARSNKREDWRRSDEVATQAAEAARLLLVENRKVAATAAVTNGKLDVIHTLVNSNMTAAMQAQLAALKAQLVLMDRLAATGDSSAEELDAVAMVEAQITELEAALHDRLAATEAAAAAAAAPTVTQTP